MPIGQLLEVTPEFLLTGSVESVPEELSDDEHSLLETYRACNDEGKLIVCASAVMEVRKNTEGEK